MPTDPSTIADPLALLLTWAGGLAFVAGVISVQRLVSPGFVWLAAGSAALMGLAAIFVEDAWWGRLALLLLAVGAIWARNPRLAGPLFMAAALGYLLEGAQVGGLVPTLTAAIALGGVTGEMMLGHWYLVDPRLPRWSLRLLAVAGIAGLAADAAVLGLLGGLPGGGATAAFWVLSVTSLVLMTGVLGALRYPAYSGVMAATGLSYLAVLTTLGAVFLGRALVAGLGPFAN